MSDFFWFSDAQWARIEPLLPTDVRGKKRVDDRRVLSGIVHALRCGGRWTDCAGVYGPKKTLYNRFVRWAERGIWEDIFSALAGAEDAPDRLFVDSTCIKVHRCAGGGKGGPLAHGVGLTKGGRNTKLHAVCDAKGRPLVLLLTPGNVHDCKVAQLCIEAMPPSAELVADKGYDSQALREWLAGRGTQAVIPPRKNRKIQYDYDAAIYRQRNVIERMFRRLKDWRRIATRFDRNIKSFIGAIALAATVIRWL
ncbi:IS5 family transposase [Phenylobacterium sp.]|uniref:IS5 family transposase n=1 Tax=Phenylobacterium sp. TaxID=1871053 RepID=UPI0025F72CD2|nr:IS5 family transposase [Phenylobacterium sp.]MCA3720623.1 IS5 family transposase [Phenylobacterium sp.]